jgi:hypothetical protein
MMRNNNNNNNENNKKKYLIFACHAYTHSAHKERHSITIIIHIFRRMTQRQQGVTKE